MNIFIESKDSVAWIRSLTEAFSDFFLREIPKITKHEKTV